MNSDRTIYLHIGTQKTGTTTLQYVGGKNRQLLMTRGIYYARTPGEQNHIKLAAYGFENPRLAPLRAAPFLRQLGFSSDEHWDAFQHSFPEQLRQEIGRSGCDKVILSTEFLSARLTRIPEVQRIAVLLRQLGQVKVICYLRPQHELFLSLDSSHIKAGSVDHLGPPESDRHLGYNYQLMLDLWATVFGEENIIVRIFDRELLVGGDVVQDFFSVIGENVEMDLEIPEDLNKRLDADTTNFLILLNRYLPTFNEDRRNPERGDIVEALQAVAGGRKPAIDADVLRGIMQLYAPSNAVVARRFLSRSDGVLFPNIEIADEPGGNRITAEKAAEIAAHLWKWQRRQIVDPGSGADRSAAARRLEAGGGE